MTMPSLLNDGEVTLTLVAHGIIQLAAGLEKGLAISAPYPDPLQQALDRMTVAAWRRGDTPPQSVPELIRWCAERPLVTWPLTLPQGALGEDDRLLNLGVPSEICLEWAMEAGGDVEAQLQEERLMEHVLRFCREQGRQDTYVAFRELIISRPAILASDLLTLRTTEPLTILIDTLREAYDEAPEICVDPKTRTLAVCGRCGNLLLWGRNQSWVCVEDSCQAEGPTRVGTTYPAGTSVLWAKRGLRRFVAAPGREELRLAVELRGLGLNVALWPAFDAYDLRVSFPASDQIWAIDVKDWANPFALGKKLRDDVLPINPPWDRAFYVFPSYRRIRRRDYMDALLSQWRRSSNSRIQALFADDLVREIQRAIRR